MKEIYSSVIMCCVHLTTTSTLKMFRPHFLKCTIALFLTSVAAEGKGECNGFFLLRDFLFFPSSHVGALQRAMKSNAVLTL